LEELVKHKHHKSSEEKLGNDEARSNKAELTNWSIHSGEEIGKGLTESDEESEKLLGSLE